MGFLNGKRALIVGVASNRSIAWGIAQAMHREGAELAFTYQGDRLKDRVVELASGLGSDIVLPLDVTDDAQIDAVFAALKERWGRLDILVHSVAYAPADQVRGDFLENITREGFHIAHDISAYSFAALAKAAKPLLEASGRSALLTLTYLGSQRAIPNYNTMGVAKAALEATTRYLARSLGPIGGRVNAISAGPIKTLAASGIGNFRKILDHVAQVAPLGRNITQEEVGNAAAFLCSDLASGITGEILYVDGGYNITGMALPGVD
ncbi:MAG: enoyl-[acyl-carrier-protein] reductase [NADH] [Gammaproteobacteria bacterium]|nr:MAG: enoyl-[acyl-carrier-protein] reductase [NADH] [Gammaproteobacteria bacterium]